MENDRLEVMEYLMYSNSVIKMSIGAVINGMVHKNYVVIHEAPPRVVKEVTAKFQMISLTTDGLLIPLSGTEGK